jgi:Domain of unknown function (DUF1874).
MTVYIFNSLILPISPQYRKAIAVIQRISADEAKELLKNNTFVSVVGHEATAQLLTQLLGVNIPTNRIAVQLQKGDTGLHFVLKQRLPEGKVLSYDELKALQYELVKSTVVDAE